jgi:hypothetical protein
MLEPHVRHRLAERLGSLAREAARELAERRAGLERIEERIRGLIVVQAEGDRSPMVAQMRADFEAQARAERAAVEELQARLRCCPSENRRIGLAATACLADADNVHFRQSPSQGAHDIVVEVFVGGEANHCSAARRASKRALRPSGGNRISTSACV